MAKGMSLKVLMQLQTREFQKGLRNIQRQLNGFKGFMKSAFALGSVTMFGRQMVQVSKDFEDAMARVQAVSNATNEEFKKMEAEAMRLGRTTKFTATEAAGALENLTRNGVSATKATKMLSGVLQLAQANSIDLALAANIMTNTLNMYTLSVESAQRVSDVLSSTAAHAATDITLLYEAMSNAAPAAKLIGFSLEETAAAIGAFAQRGIKGAEAGTKLRIAFQKLSDPKIEKKLKDRGILIDENTMKAEGLSKTIQKLASAGLTLGDLGTIFDARSSMSLAILMSSLDEFNRLLNVTENSAGEAERMFNQSLGSVQKELFVLKSKYQDFLITMGKQTKGLVKGGVKLIQDIIDNFKTFGGTIANLASVLVPALTGRIISLGRTMSAVFKQAAVDAATMQAAMGGWVTLIATLVTWVGSYLYTAWRKNNQAMRDANKEMEKAQASASDMSVEIDRLKRMIGTGTDSDSLNKAIADATRLFPDFADAIAVAAEAARRKIIDFKELQGTLEEIARLQSLIETGDAYSAQAKANKQLISSRLVQSTNIPPSYRGYRETPKYQSAVSEIKKGLKVAGVTTNEGVKQYFDNIVDAIVDNGNSKDRYAALGKVLSSRGIKLSNQQMTDLVNGVMSSVQTGGAYNNASEDYRLGNEKKSAAALSEYNLARETFENVKKIEEQNLNDRLISQEMFQSRMERAAEEYIKKAQTLVKDKGLRQSYLDTALQNVKGFYPAKVNTPPGGGGSGSGKEPKEPVNEAIKAYNEKVTELNNRLDAGTISAEDYTEQMKKLVDNTWEAITAVSGFADILASLGQTELGEKLKTGYNKNRTDEGAQKIAEQLGKLGEYTLKENKGREDDGRDWKRTKEEKMELDLEWNKEYADKAKKLVDDLQKAIEKGDFNLVKDDAIDVLEDLKLKALAAGAAAEDLQTKLDISEIVAKLDYQIKSLEESVFNSFEGFAESMDRVMRGLMSIAEVFDEDIKDSPFYQAFEAFNSVLNSSIQIMQGVMSAIELVKQIQSKAAKEKLKDAIISAGADKIAAKAALEKATAEGTDAAASGAKAVANIPYVGPILAVAAAASIVTALLAAASKLKGFAKGGIVGGNSYAGDNNVVRANSSEMILTRGQQASLWKAIQSGNLGSGGKVDFIIRGDQLVGTLQNYNRLRR